MIPLSVGAAAVFPYEPGLAEKYILPPVYEGDSPVLLSKVVGDGVHRRVWLPRGMFPAGGMDCRVDGQKTELPNLFVPRHAEQSRVVSEATDLLRSGESFVLQAPTGFGKTYVGSALIANVGRTALVIVNKEDIVEQWMAAFKDVLGLGQDQVGLLKGDICSVQGKPVVIGFIQSLCKYGRYPNWVYNYFGLVMWDETHRVGAEVFSETAWMFPARLRMGLSATPKRKDGRDKVLWAHIGQVRVKSDAANMAFKVLRKRTGWKVPGYVQYGQWKQIPHKHGRTMTLSKAMAGNGPRNTLIGQFVGKAYAQGRHTIVFCDTLEHLETLKAVCVHHGVSAGDIAYYVGGLSKEKRAYAKTRRLILATYAMAKEATDIPRLDTAVLATPRSDVEQIIGRILRTHDDKLYPAVLDLIDDDSHVFRDYASARLRYYRALETRGLCSVVEY